MNIEYKDNGQVILSSVSKEDLQNGEFIIPEQVTVIGDRAFRQCYGLTRITIPANVTAIGEYAFAGCIYLTQVTIPDSVTVIGNGAFRGCGFKSITIPDKITAIGPETFYNCLYLKSVTVPEGVTAIGQSAFAACHALAHILLPVSVTAMEANMFRDTKALVVVDTDDPAEVERIRNLLPARKLPPESSPNNVVTKKIFQIQQQVLDRFVAHFPIGGLTQITELYPQIQNHIAQFTPLNATWNLLATALANVPGPVSESEADLQTYKATLKQLLEKHIRIHKLHTYIRVLKDQIPVAFRKGFFEPENPANKEVVQTWGIAKKLKRNLLKEEPLCLTLSDYQLIRKKPRLLEIWKALAEDKPRIYSQWEKQFHKLLMQLQFKTSILIEKGTPGRPGFSPRYQRIARAAGQLIETLTDTGKLFFANPTVATAAEFRKSCHQAIHGVETEFKKNRSTWSLAIWNELHPVLKGIAGILAIVTIIPAIMVARKSDHGFRKTFFDKSPSDSWKKLHDFDNGLNQLGDSMDAFQEDQLLMR